MNLSLIDDIALLNPWLNTSGTEIIDHSTYRNRVQADTLLLSEWDNLCIVLTGPRQAGKTTLGKYLSDCLLAEKRYDELLYLNCDFERIRAWLSSPVFIKEAMAQFNLKRPIIFIDEVQRLDSPGLLLKAIVDLKLPIKLMATGSSQLEIKSKVQEHMTGRAFTATILPLNLTEWPGHIEERLLFGSYPRVIDSTEKKLILSELYTSYISKDIVEILNIGKPEILKKLITLLAHGSGQLVKVEQLANDCQVSVTMIRHYLSVLENTYVVQMLRPFVGNKRSELTSAPIYYFIDNGFRNHALNNFTDINIRADIGLLVENFVFQELYKHKVQQFQNYEIYYWRTKAKAEVDFVICKDKMNTPDSVVPIEVKYRNMKKAMLTRGLRSFIDAYQPKNALVITKNLVASVTLQNTTIQFIPLNNLEEIFSYIT